MLAKNNVVVAQPSKRFAAVPAGIPTLRKAVIVRFKNENEDSNYPGVVNKTEEKTGQEPSLAPEGLTKSWLKTAGGKPEYDPSEIKVSRWIPVFTRRREIFIGRIAILGFVAACFIEALYPTHPNIMQQFAGVANMAGIPISTGQVALLLGLTFLYNTIPALSPDSPTWSRENQEDVAKRPPGPPGQWVSPLNFTQFFGVSRWGFTKANELFNGRMAMLGFAAALAHQLVLGGLNGPGPLAQFALIYANQTPQQLWDSFPTTFGIFTVFATVLAYVAGKPGSIKGEDEIY